MLLALPTASGVKPAVLYVDDDCGAVAGGGRTTPFCTVQDAVFAAGPGATIQVAAGTYNGDTQAVVPVHLRGAQAGVPGDAPSRSDPSKESIWDGAILLLFGSEAGSSVDGFTFRNVTGSQSAVTTTSSAAGHHILVAKNRLADPTLGITVGRLIGLEAPTGLVVQKNEIVSVETGIWVSPDSAADGLFSKNSISSSFFDGIAVDPGNSGLTFAKNHVGDSGGGCRPRDRGTAGTANTYTKNTCDTSAPDGLC